MTNPPAARSRGGQRFYEWRRERYWSVTTIIGGGIPKPVLVNWAKKFTAEYAVTNYEKLGKLLEPDADGNVDIEGAVDWLKGAAYRDRDRAADLGTLIHAWIEAHRLGKPMPEPRPDTVPYLRAFEAFLDRFNPTYEATEASVFNRTERYAGTLDAIVRLRLPQRPEPSRHVLDAKTGKGVYPEVALQLAAYREAEFIGAPDGSEQEMPATDATGLALHLAPNAYRLIEVDAGPEVFRDFLYAREVFRWCGEASKAVFGAEYADEIPEEVAA